MWHNIPSELRALNQWVCAGPDKIPLNPRTGALASTVDPSTWGTFEEALHSGYRFIGFVLTANDPYTIIDLDNKPHAPLTTEQWQIHERILTAFESYTERSASGRGYHIIVRGRVPAGVHGRDGVEVYSQARYMICTGDVVRQVPIGDYQSYLDRLYGEMHPDPTTDLNEEYEGPLSDNDLVEMAMNAANGDKYLQLCKGEWQNMGYPSQSEADYALLAMLAYYSQDNEQVRRLFRYSALGKREKAIRNNDYLNRCLKKIRAKQPEPVDLGSIRDAALALVGNSVDGVENPAQPCIPSVNQPPTPPEPTVPAPPTVPTQVLSNAQSTPPPSDLKGLSLPPGLVGEMAWYFYESAIRPVPEVSLAAAIALTAGVVGRSYNISGTGLNQYLILIARTGSGKEGAAGGIDNLISQVRPQIPMIDDFIGPGAFASGQALIRVLDERPCFVSVLGEFGLTLQQLCDPRANSAQVMLRKVLLDLYAKSGWTKTLYSSAYSDQEKNTKVVQAPCVTILGESTPERFFEGLDGSHISEGLIPRFSIIEYTGKRPRRNLNANRPPDKYLVDKFASLVATSLVTANNHTCLAVQTAPDAQALLDELDRGADDAINSASQDVEMQLWNRAHLKALKLSALLAVGVNPHQPVVTADLAHWAIDFVRRDVETMSTKFKSGDVGVGDSKLVHDLKRTIRSYFLNGYETVGVYGVDPRMYQDHVIPYVFLARRTSNLAPFKLDRRGASGALRSALQDAIDSGVLVEIPPLQMNSKYSSRAKGYGVGPAWQFDKAV